MALERLGKSAEKLMPSLAKLPPLKGESTVSRVSPENCLLEAFWRDQAGPQAFLGACPARMDGRPSREVRKIPNRHFVFS